MRIAQPLTMDMSNRKPTFRSELKEYVPIKLSLSLTIIVFVLNLFLHIGFTDLTSCGPTTDLTSCENTCLLFALVRHCLDNVRHCLVVNLMMSTKFIMCISNGRTSMKFSIARTIRWNCISHPCLAALVWMCHHLKSVRCFETQLLISTLNLINVHPQFKVQCYCKTKKPFRQTSFWSTTLTTANAHLDYNLALFHTPRQTMTSNGFNFLQPVFIRQRHFIVASSYFQFF